MSEEVKEWALMWGARVKLPCDMKDDMLKDAIETSRKIIDPAEFDNKGLEYAEKIKSEFDSRWVPHWHVVIGRSFGSFVTHETSCFIYFYLYEGKAVMMFKAG
jgi:dynein light chain LC8-type